MTNKQPRIVEYEGTEYTNLEGLRGLKEAEERGLKQELESIGKDFDEVDLDMLQFDLDDIPKDKVWEIAYKLGSCDILDLIT